MSRRDDIRSYEIDQSVLPDAALADQMNTIKIPAVVRVPTRDIRKYLTLKGVIGIIEMTSRGSSSYAADCISLLYMLNQDDFDSLDYNDNEVILRLDSILTALAPIGISEQYKNDILAMGNQQVAKYNPPISEIEVAFARRGTVEESAQYE